MKKSTSKRRRRKRALVPFKGPIYPLEAKLLGARFHRLADMAGVRWDLNWCAEVCALLDSRQYWKKLPGVEVIEALHDTLFIRYARCFKGGVRTAFRIPNAWIADLPATLRDWHHHAIAVRDKHVAHSVNDYETNTPVAVLRRKKDGELLVRGIRVLRGNTLVIAVESTRKFRRLARALLARLTRDIRAEQARLLPIVMAIPASLLEQQLYDYQDHTESGRRVDQPRPKS
jgi:hypothetical protein